MVLRYGFRNQRRRIGGSQQNNGSSREFSRQMGVGTGKADVMVMDMGCSWATCLGSHTKGHTGFHGPSITTKSFQMGLESFTHATIHDV